jgi:prepilin peptidase CpaA
MIEMGALIVFPLLMALAGFSDLLTMIISNRISIALIAAFLVIGLALHMPLGDFVAHLSCGFMVLVLTFLMFWRGWIGGGDAKLAASTAVWLGWSHILDYGLAASIAGGALTLVILMLRNCPLPRGLTGQRWLVRLHEQGNGIPYGIALAAAGLLVYPDTQIWLSAIQK